MNKVMTILGLTFSLAAGAFAQTKPTTPTTPAASDSGKAISSAKVADAMKHLPPDVAAKIEAAREAAKAAKADVDAMKAAGKTPAEIEAMIADKKAAALLNLQKALDALNGLPDGAKENVAKAKDQVTKRLDERKAEAKNP